LGNSLVENKNKGAVLEIKFIIFKTALFLIFVSII
jgi:hypothetical protein